MCSDHFSPWSERQGQSAFAWSWLGAALQATSLPFGVVNAPGQRYHPAIIAQAIATLGAMFEGRFWVALGTGEASNEHITGERWPRKERAQRPARASACEIIRALLAGEEVSHDGLVTVDRARVWTRPKIQPKLIGAAVSVETAGWVGRLGRRPGHDRPARRQAAADDRRLPVRGRRRTAGAAGAPRATRRRWPRRGRSPSTSGGPMSSPRRSAGTSTTSRPSTPRRRSSGSRTSRSRSSSPTTWAPTPTT